MGFKSVVLTVSAAFLAVGFVTDAVADVKVGVIQSLSGPAASQGIPQTQAIKIGLPSEIDGEKVSVFILDDGSDPARANSNAKKLIEEQNVDVIIGPTTVPSGVALTQMASAAKVPVIANAPVSLGDARDEWLFTVPPPPSKWIIPIIADMKKRGVRTVGFLGFSDAWGDLSYETLKTFAQKEGFEIVSDERYSRNDTSVTGQVLQLLSSNPDAIFLGVSGTAGVLGNVAINQQSYAGPIYNGNGVFNGNFLTLGGPEIEGVYGSVGAIAIAGSLPDTDPRKPVVLDFISKYDAKYGAGKADAISGFGYDAALLASLAIKKSLQSAKPGSENFRDEISKSLRSLRNIPGTHSIYNFLDPKSPWGAGDDAAFLVKVQQGKWVRAN